MSQSMKETSGGIDHYRMYINGEFKDSVSGEKIDVASPTTEEVLYTVPKGDAEDASARAGNGSGCSESLGGDAGRRAR